MSQNKPENITVDLAIKLIDEAEKLYYKANKYSQNNQYYEAAKKLQEAIDILKKQEKLAKFFPEDLAISYTNLGTLQLLLGQANDAGNWDDFLMLRGREKRRSLLTRMRLILWNLFEVIYWQLIQMCNLIFGTM